MWMSLLASAAAAIVNALVGRFFPQHPKVTPEVIAQAQKDRADTLQSQKEASREADTLRSTVQPTTDELRRPDANERHDP